MRILFTNFHEYYGGGQTTYILALAKAFSCNHDVMIATPKTSQLYQKAIALNLKVIDIQFRLKLNHPYRGWQNLKRLRRLFKKEPFDVIHVNGSADHTLSILACTFLRHKPRLVLTKHNSLPLKWGARFRSRFATDAIIAVCHYVRQQLLSYDLGAQKSTTIYNGIDTTSYQPQPEGVKQAIRKKWDIPEDAFVFGSVAGTARYKGWQYLCAVLADLKMPGVKIMLAGESLSAADYQQHILDAGIADQVILTGEIADVRTIIPAFDVGFVLSDRIETISFAAREMMAMGIPVLSSDFAGLPENIVQGENGWLCPAGDISTLRALVQKLIALPKSTLLTHGLQARVHAEKQFAAKQFFSETLAVYQAATNFAKDSKNCFTP